MGHTYVRSLYLLFDHRARDVLGEVTERLKENGSFIPLKLEFSGIGRFDTSVVFVKLRDGPAKEKLHEIAGNCSEQVEHVRKYDLLLGLYLGLHFQVHSGVHVWLISFKFMIASHE